MSRNALNAAMSTRERSSLIQSIVDLHVPQTDFKSGNRNSVDLYDQVSNDIVWS
jgi:hypothetical protein